MSNNPNKTISVTAKSVMVHYTDTNKHFVYQMKQDSPTRDVVLFGKKVGHSLDTKKDFLTPEQRTILEDILYSKHKYSREEIKKMPLIRQYYLTDVARKAEFVLDKWRKKLAEERFNQFLSRIFHKSKIIKQMTEVDAECNLFPESKITDFASEEQIVEYLRQKGLFPSL